MTYNYKCLDCNLEFNVKEEDMIMGEETIMDNGCYFRTLDAMCPMCKTFAVWEGD